MTPRKKLIGACIYCGCTDDHACPGGCYWIISHKVCSNPKCVEKAKKEGLI